MFEGNIRGLPNDPSFSGLAEIIKPIEYSNISGERLELTLILPWKREKEDRLFPLIVFVQGSAWTSPNVGYEIPQLSLYAQNGYAVATVTHRNCLEGHPFPAYLQDIKTSIRFLRYHSEEYHIDKERVCIWGTSSGGNAALLVGLTGDDPVYKTEEFAAESDAVKIVVECFGPTDLTGLSLQYADNGDNGIFSALSQGSDFRETMREMSPLFKVREGMQYPPVLILHGDADDVVPYEQGERMYRRLVECGANVQMIRVYGAPHEGSFWSREVRGAISDYISEKL